MATKKQILAKHLNSQKSTGPRSSEGNAVSSQNALKSGIDAEGQVIRGEVSAELTALAEEYLRDHAPQTAAEWALVDTLIDTEWLLRRLRRAEAHLWETEFFEIIEHHDRRRANEPLENRLLSKAFQNSRETFTRLERRREYLHRTYHRALHDLRELQASDPQPEPHNPAAPSVSPEPAAAPSATPSQQTPNPEIGCVPANPHLEVVEAGPPAACPHSEQSDSPPGL
jgi:hypothetical protein